VSFREKEANKTANMEGSGLVSLAVREADKVNRGVEMKMLATIDEGITYINNRVCRG